MTEEDSDLAILAAVGGPAVRVPPLNDYQTVCLFLDQHGVSKGLERGIEVCTLYRLYQGWQEGQPEVVGVRPFSFAKQLRRIGYRKRHDGGRGADKDAMVLLVNRVGASFLRRWRKEHPDSREYRQWFQSKFMKQRVEARKEKE